MNFKFNPIVENINTDVFLLISLLFSDVSKKKLKLKMDQNSNTIQKNKAKMNIKKSDEYHCLSIYILHTPTRNWYVQIF